MTAEVLNLPRAGATVRPPLVPAGIKLDDADFLRLECEIADTAWIQMSQPVAALAGIVLRIRALRLKDHAGSLPDDDRFLAFSANFRTPTALQDWRAHKAEALEGWVLCSDNRWYLPEVARNVLHIWIGRLEDRRISAWGNISKKPQGGDYGIFSIQADVAKALDALRGIDPQDRVLGKSTRQWHEWQERIEDPTRGLAVPASEAAEPNRSPIGSPNRTPQEGDPKVRQAKRSQTDSSSLPCNDDSSEMANQVLEIEQRGGSAKRTTGDRTAERPRPPPWPVDSFGYFQERYPKREAWGRAEKVWERIRKAGKVPFDEIMAGVERLVARIDRGELEARFACQPAKWLDGRGWEDDPDPPDPETTGPGRRPTRGRPSALAGLRRRFEHRPQPGEGA